MKFNEITYIRPDLDSYVASFEIQVKYFREAGSADKADEAMQEIYRLRRHFDTMLNICSVRHTINTSDPFYEAEQNFYDEHLPDYQRLVNEFYRALVISPFRDTIVKVYGHQLFNIAELTLKTFSDEVMEDLKEENLLSSEYTRLLAAAQIEYEGNTYNLSGLAPFQLSTNREERINSAAAFYGFFSQHRNTLDELFDRLVKIRHRIAQKLGFRSFTELAYARMNRSDYDADMVSAFRDLVLREVVPAAQKIKEKQRLRLGIEKMMYFDDGLDFASGNAKPHGSAEWILNHASTMYAELSPQTNEFFQFMRRNELMDLVNKPDKAAGGYCTFFSEFKSPFIFSNFNGTSHDIDVLTHEAGHAFQGYCSRNYQIDEYYYPTLEACEIHSMSMEFLTWPWMPLFFGKESDKYKYAHLSHSLSFIPYGVSVDEFQHEVYDHPEMTPAERNATWRRIEKMYMPWKEYDIPYLNDGCYWHKQPHIFRSPFYYIDYTLAQLCAFQFWKKSNENRQQALIEYVRLCEAGGSKPFLELVNLANLESPFQESTIKNVVMEVESWLNSIDDSRMN